MKNQIVYKLVSFLIIMLCLFCNVIPSFAQKGGSGGGCTVPSPPPSIDTSWYSGSGGLDTTFDFDGISHFTPASDVTNIEFQAVAVQSDGKIVATGVMFNSTTRWDIFVARYNADGSLDYSFGNGNGYITDSVEPGYIVDIAYAVKIQPDGKILVGGYGGSAGRGVVFRYNIDGTRDTSFGTNGVAVPNFPVHIRDLALQSDSKILAGGGGNGFSVFRLNSNGSVDTSFGTNGYVSVNPSTSNSGSGDAYSIAVQTISGQERLVLGGYMRDSKSGAYKFGLVRLTPGGALDASFGSGGRVSTSFFGINDTLYSLVIDANNKIVAGGSASTSCRGADAAVARYNVNGTLDTTFSGDGKANTDVYGYADVARKILVQPDGKIVTVGYSQKGSYANSTYDISVIRLNSDGSADSSFGPGQSYGFGNGIAATEISAGNDYAYAGALQSDGKIIAAGKTQNTTPRTAFLIRYLP